MLLSLRGSCRNISQLRSIAVSPLQPEDKAGKMCWTGSLEEDLPWVHEGQVNDINQLRPKANRGKHALVAIAHWLVVDGTSNTRPCGQLPLDQRKAQRELLCRIFAQAFSRLRLGGECSSEEPELLE